MTDFMLPEPIKTDVKYNNPFDYFDEIYCVNLDERVDRWLGAKVEFEKMGILDRVQRFSAIKKPKGRDGCWASHVSIIEIAKNKNLKNVLIFEDDVKFDKNAKDILSVSVNNLILYPEWHLYYIGYFLGRSSTNPRSSKYGYGLLEKLFLLQSNFVLINCAVATHAYAVNNTIYDQIIKDYKSIKSKLWAIDSYYAMEIQTKYKCYGVYPVQADQYVTMSDISNKEYGGVAFSESHLDICNKRIVDCRPKVQDENLDNKTGV